jgi:hypothetical protein
MGARTLLTTVVTPATPPANGTLYDLTDLATIKAELDITGGAKDTVIKGLITRASAAAAQYCNRVFQVETVKDEFWAQRDPFPHLVQGKFEPLQLSRWPITSVTTVTENAVALVDPTDFRTDLPKGQLVRMDGNGYPRHWPSFPIAVTYAAGYATTPADVVDAVVRMVKKRWFDRTRDPALMSENISGVYESRWWIATGSEAGAMTPDVTDLLDNYRVPVIA